MGHLLKIKWVVRTFKGECDCAHGLASKSVPFTLTTVQVPNLALTHTKRIVLTSTEQDRQTHIYFEHKYLVIV